MKTANERENIKNGARVHIENPKKSRQFFVFLWIVYAVVCMTKNCYNGALASIVSEGIMTKTQTGLITAMFYLAYTPLQIVGGVVADRFNPQKMIKIGLIGATVANAVIFLNHNYYVMLAAWTFNALIQFGIWPSIFKIVSAQLFEADRKQMVFYISFSGTLGGLVLSYLIAAIVPRWELNFLISALLLAIFAVALHFYSKHLTPYFVPDNSTYQSENKKISKKEKGNTFKILLASGFFFVLTSNIVSTLVSQSRTTLTPLMLVENYSSVSASMANLLNIFMVLAGVAGTILARKYFSKPGKEIKSMIITCAVLIPVLILCRFVGKAPVSLMIAIFCSVAVIEAIPAMMRSYFNINFVRYGISGTAAGVMNAGSAFSYMLSAYAMSKIADIFGWGFLVKMWPVMTFISVIILLVSLPVYKKFKNMEKSEEI